MSDSPRNIWHVSVRYIDQVGIEHVGQRWILANDPEAPVPAIQQVGDQAEVLANRIVAGLGLPPDMFNEPNE